MIKPSETMEYQWIIILIILELIGSENVPCNLFKSVNTQEYSIQVGI